MRRTRFTVRVPLSNIRVFGKGGLWWHDPLSPDLKTWLIEYGSKPKYQRYGAVVVFAFKTEQEALMFSLRWL